MLDAPSSEPRVLFSQLLIRARQRHCLTKVALAAQCGLSYKHIANLEAGKRPITLDALHRLDKRLHFPNRVMLAIARGKWDVLGAAL